MDDRSEADMLRSMQMGNRFGKGPGGGKSVGPPAVAHHWARPEKMIKRTVR